MTQPPGRRCVLEGPPLGPGGQDITWPDQVAPRGRKASSTRKIKPQTSNLCPLTLLSLAPCCLPLGVLPSLVPFPGPPLALLLSLAHRAHCASSCRSLLTLHPCPSPRCLPVHFTGSHPLALPPAGRGAPSLLRCSVLPSLPLSAVQHWFARCACPPDPSCSPWRSDLPLADPISSP